MSEEWRPVVGYEGCYEVSEWGQVRGLPRTYTTCRGHTKSIPPRILAPTINKTGYPALRLTNVAGETRTWRIHVLVAQAFLGPRPEGMVACHNDGDKLNSHVSNLRWDTRSGNNLDMLRHGTHHKAKRTHCVRGHEFTLENTYYAPSRPTSRECRTCIAEMKARRRARLKRQAAAA